MADTGAPSMSGRKKIAVLGGGPAALSALFELTGVEGWRDRYEITVYQMGWRLGGKCATGRGPNGRICEHGIHAFSGGYYNALGMMARCYQEMAKLKPPGFLHNFDDAFIPGDAVLLWEADGRELKTYPYELRKNNIRHHDMPAAIAQVEEIMSSANALGKQYYDDCVPKPGQSRIYPSLWPSLRWLIGHRREVCALRRLCRKAGLFRSLSNAVPATIAGVGGLFNISRLWRRLRRAANYGLTLFRCIFSSRFNVFRDGFVVMDDMDFSDMLDQNLLNADTGHSPLVYNTPDLSYNYPDGDNCQKPAMAAGAYLRWTFRMLLNIESFGWSFAAGTGESVVAPLYYLLKERGVTFRFFHKVTGLHPSADGPTIDSISIDVQAEPAAGFSEYDPLVPVACPGAAQPHLLCWPDRPIYERLSNGEALRAANIDLESYWSDYSRHQAGKITLKRGEDFDEIVFGISIGAVPILCGEILERNDDTGLKWRRMVEGTPACATQTMQIWLDLPADEIPQLGRKSRWPLISGTFITPFNGVAFYPDLIKFEGWSDPALSPPSVIKSGTSAGPPTMLIYFTGAMPMRGGDYAPFSDRDFPGRQADKVKAAGAQFLKAVTGHLADVLPTALVDWDPMALDFQLLAIRPSSRTTTKGGQPGLEGAETVVAATEEQGDSRRGVWRFENQFWRANIDPTERYVQCPRGSPTSRLDARNTGFDNLKLAGDWTWNGLFVGSFEGAVMGGKLAAHAISDMVPIECVTAFPLGAPNPFTAPMG